MRIPNHLMRTPKSWLRALTTTGPSKAFLTAQAAAVLALILSLPMRAFGAEDFTLETDSLIWRGETVGNLRPARIQDKLSTKVLELTGQSFQLVLGDGTLLKASDFKPIGLPELRKLKAEP